MSTKIDTKNLVDDYLKEEDWRVRENSNIGYSLSGLLMHIAGSVIANYTLGTIYPEEISNAHRNGDLHIHDISLGGVAAYCAGWNLRQLLIEGFNGVEGKIESGPPKHLDSALLQIINFIGTLQNEWAGAQAFNSIDTYLAPFIRVDNLSYKQIKQAIQTFVFNLNISSRWGSQAPFSNLSFDWIVPDDLRNTEVILGGKTLPYTYGDFQPEMDVINKAFLEVFMEGDSKGRPFTFPIPTYSLTREFNWDSENANLLFTLTSKYGLPNFQNFINSDLRQSDVRSMCCRLSLNLNELRKNITGGLFGSSDNTGAIGVVTLNLPRLGFLARGNEIKFYTELENLMVLAKDSLEIKRTIVSKHMESGLLPYSKRYLKNIDRHFSTIGLIGVNECCLNMFGYNIEHPNGKQFAINILQFMRSKLEDFQRDTGHLFNLESSPAEGTSYRLAKIDKKMFPTIITAGKTIPFYTNSTQLPVDSKLSLFEAVEHQESIQKLYTGGTIFHTFIGESLPDGESSKILLKKLAYNSRLPYLTITPTYSICPNHGYLKGKVFECPSCGERCEIYSRVVGYFRPISNWNDGKQEEFKLRNEFKVNNIISSEQNTQNTQLKFNYA